MEAEFSKKICQRLTDYETYIKNECKSPLLQKDKVLVDRDELLKLLADLKSFHCVNLQIAEFGELDFGTVQMTKEQILKNAVWQAEHMISEAEIVRNITLEERVADAKKEAEKILAEAKAFDEKVKAEAEEIVSTTLAERRQELETARKKLEEERIGIIAAAKQEGQMMLEEVQKRAEELRKQLDSEIELYRKAREMELKQSLHDAQKITQESLEEKTREALRIYADTLHKTEEMVNLITAIYAQQMEVIEQDRQDIIAIVEKLERRGLQRKR